MTGRFPEMFMGLDPRVKLLGAVILGCALWMTRHVVPVALSFSALLFFALALARVNEQAVRMLRGYVWFVLLWTLIRVLFSLPPAESWGEFALSQVVFALRLSSFMLIGVLLATGESPTRMGAAVAAILQPFLRDRAWQVALAFTVMVNTLPTATDILASVKQQVSLRCAHLPLRHRIVIMSQALLRNMGKDAWSRAVAIASRKFDAPQSWRLQARMRPSDWCVLVVLLFWGAGIAVFEWLF